MRIDRLTTLDADLVLRADIAIVGGGPVGLTIAERCGRAGLSVLVLESGLEAQDEAHEELNTVELDGTASSETNPEQRRAFHSPLAKLWSPERQAYGVRCRGLGGSTQAWAGKSAPFDAIDYRRREWVKNSGWPISPEELTSYIRAAGELLNLCPIEPEPRFKGEGLASFYWQFARSRIDHFDVMRLGREFAARRPLGVDICLDATVTRISLDRHGCRVLYLEVADGSGQRRRVVAEQFVLAASAIENARLLLVSNDVASAGIGNQYDNVGRYMIDHAGIRVGCFQPADITRMAKVFGFCGVGHLGRSHMFMHGLALDPQVQEAEGLLNASIWFAPERAPDDPWDSLKRLLKNRSSHRLRDLASIARGSGTLGRGIATKMVSSPRLPTMLKTAIVNSAIALSPNLVAAEFASGGLPHKLCGLSIEAVTEQEPHPENRITLGVRRDRFGVPLPRAHWCVGDRERRTLMVLAQRLDALLATKGLPRPLSEDWVNQNRPDEAEPIDLAHTMGTTRMSTDEKTGVVDSHCRVHGIANLYLAGGSVFPTGGHANPTWMMLAMACRLSDRLQQVLG